MAKSMPKRTVVIAGNRTSFSMEDEFYEELVKTAKAAGRSLASVVNEVYQDHVTGTRAQNLSSALRLYVLANLKQQMEVYRVLKAA